MKKRNLSILSLTLTALLLIPQNIMALTQSNTTLEAATSSTKTTGSKNIRKSQLKNLTENSLNKDRNPNSSEPKTEKDKIQKEIEKNRKKIASKELIITFKEGTSDTSKKSVNNKNKLKVKKNIKAANSTLVELPENTILEEAISILKSDPTVEAVQPNYLYYPSESTISTDPLSSELWGLENIGQVIKGSAGTTDVDIDIQGAWDITKGSNDIIIGVIDTGIDINHPDLKDKIWTNPREIPDDGIDNDGNGYIDDVHGWDFFNNDNTVFDPMDGDIHGTHVAGTIAAAMNDIGVIGVAPNVKIMPLKFLGPVTGDTASAIEALNYAKKMGVKITNNSWGGGEEDTALKFAINNSRTLFVAAAGNETLNIDTSPRYPAAFDSPYIISVAAIDNKGEMANFSNFGQTSVDVAAPGVSILSTIPKQYDIGAAIGSDTGIYKTLYQSFGLESMYLESERSMYMERALNHFGISSGDKVLLVQDDESGGWDQSFTNCLPYYKEPLELLASSMGYALDVHTVPIGSDGPDSSLLDQYDLVIWFTGKAMGGKPEGIITTLDVTNLSSYLNNGGNLFLINPPAPSIGLIFEFLRDYLHVEIKGSMMNGRSSISGEEETIFDDISISILPGMSVISLAPYDSLGKVYINYPGDADFNNAYDHNSGTSMAAPHVTGIAALLLSNNKSQTPAQLKNAIMRSTTFSTNLIGVVGTSGIVNAEAALLSEPDDDIPGVPLAKPSITGALDEIKDLNDVFSISLKQGEKINFSLTGDGVTDFDLHLFDSTASSVNSANGLLESSENPYTSSENITFTAAHTGTYYINAYAYAGVGSYTLTYEKDEEIIFDDTDPSITYTGDWKEDISFFHYEGTAKTLNSQGSMSFRFTGSNIVLKGFKSPTQGIASVFVDGELAASPSFYSTTYEYDQEMFSKDIPYGTHTIEIKWTGISDENSRRKTNTSINIDSLAVRNTKVPAPLQLLGAEPLLNALKLEYSNEDFNTRKINVYRSEDSVNYSLIDSVIHEIPFPGMNNYYTDKNVEDKVYYYKLTSVDSLGTESELSNAVQGRPLISNSKFTLDDSSNHISYLGTWTVEDKIGAYNDKVHTTTEAGAKAIIPFTGYNLNIKFSGGMNIGMAVITSPSGARVGHIFISPGQGDVYYSFYSDSRIVNGPWAIECLNGTVSIDSVEIEDLTETAPSAPSTLQAVKDGINVNLSWNDNKEIDVKGYNVYRSTELGVKGDKLNIEMVSDLMFTDSTIDPSTTYYYTIAAVNYAGFESETSNEVEILGEAASESIFLRYEETDKYVKFSDKWKNASLKELSKGKAKHSSKAEDYVEFTFTGTSISIIGIAAPDKGKAKVSIDNSDLEIIDAYSPVTTSQSIIFTKSGLSNDTHKLRLTVIGDKNELSSDSSITIDAFDIAQ